MVSTQALVEPVSVRRINATLAESPHLPGWARLWCLTWAHADQNGHARFATGELARLLRLSAQRTSEALAVARGMGVVDGCSTARCVVLPGHALGPCEERHR